VETWCEKPQRGGVGCEGLSAKQKLMDKFWPGLRYDDHKIGYWWRSGRGSDDGKIGESIEGKNKNVARNGNVWIKEHVPQINRSSIVIEL